MCKWTATPPMTEEELRKKREEFWDTAPAYGGAQTVWEALRAACEMEDDATAALVLEAAGVICRGTLDLVYDERGAEYKLPKYVRSAPANLIRDPEPAPAPAPAPTPAPAPAPAPTPFPDPERGAGEGPTGGAGGGAAGEAPPAPAAGPGEAPPAPAAGAGEAPG